MSNAIPSPRVIVFDPKHEFTQSIPIPKGAKAAIFAPWDARTWVWRIARDCRTPADAETIAEHIVAETREPIWGEGARMMLTTILCALQDQRGTDWSWRDLAGALARTPLTAYAGLARDHYPAAEQLVAEVTRTVASMHQNLIASLRPVYALAAAWSGSKQPQLSFRDWLYKDTAKPAVLIWQTSGAHPGPSRAYVRGMFAVLQRTVLSPDYGDRDHNIWLFADEFIQLERLDQLVPLLQTCRSRGIRCVLATQDSSSIREIYRGDATDTITSICGTVVLGAEQGPAAAWGERFVGQQRVRRYTSTTSTDSTGRTSSSGTWIEEDRPIFPAPDFGSTLGLQRRWTLRLPLRRSAPAYAVAARWQRPLRVGSWYICSPVCQRLYVKLLYVSGGSRVGLIDWPVVPHPAHRPGHVAAPWTRPGSARATYEQPLTLPQSAQQQPAAEQVQAQQQAPAPAQTAAPKAAVPTTGAAERMRKAQAEARAAAAAKAKAQTQDRIEPESQTAEAEPVAESVDIARETDPTPADNSDAAEEQQSELAGATDADPVGLAEALSVAELDAESEPAEDSEQAEIEPEPESETQDDIDRQMAEAEDEPIWPDESVAATPDPDDETADDIDRQIEAARRQEPRLPDEPLPTGETRPADEYE